LASRLIKWQERSLKISGWGRVGRLRVPIPDKRCRAAISHPASVVYLEWVDEPSLCSHRTKVCGDRSGPQGAQAGDGVSGQQPSRFSARNAAVAVLVLLAEDRCRRSGRLAFFGASGRPTSARIRWLIASVIPKVSHRVGSLPIVPVPAARRAQGLRRSGSCDLVRSPRRRAATNASRGLLARPRATPRAEPPGPGRC
jgi:hypothetical protein